MINIIFSILHAGIIGGGEIIGADHMNDGDFNTWHNVAITGFVYFDILRYRLGLKQSLMFDNPDSVFNIGIGDGEINLSYAFSHSLRLASDLTIPLHNRKFVLQRGNGLSFYIRAQKSMVYRGFKSDVSLGYRYSLAGVRSPVVKFGILKTGLIRTGIYFIYDLNMPIAEYYISLFSPFYVVLKGDFSVVNRNIINFMTVELGYKEEPLLEFKGKVVSYDYLPVSIPIRIGKKIIYSNPSNGLYYIKLKKGKYTFVYGQGPYSLEKKLYLSKDTVVDVVLNKKK